jgi:RimJ/RimL family protein N-acetyltransferase
VKEIQIRSVRPGDVFGITRVVLAARGLRGAELELQIERDLARFHRQGLIEAIESETLVAMQGALMIGVWRYGVFDRDVHLTRPEIDPIAMEVSAEEVVAAFLRDFWRHMPPKVNRAIYIDYPTSEGTLGEMFLRYGFEKYVDRTDMVISLTKPIEPTTDRLTFCTYSDQVHARFLDAFCRSFQGSLDPAMDWDARHPKKSFYLFRDRFGVFDPGMWVLATDRDGRDVGFALFQYMDSGRYGGQTMLLYTAVLPEARGQGYGEEILREGLKRVRERRGVKERVVLTVSDPNVPARRIYDRLGFRPTERFSLYVTTR